MRRLPSSQGSTSPFPGRPNASCIGPFCLGRSIRHFGPPPTPKSRDSVRRWLMAGGAFGHAVASQMQGTRPDLIQHCVCHLTSRTRRIVSCSARRRMWVGFRTVDVRLPNGLCPTRGHCLHVIAFLGKFLLGFGNGCRTYGKPSINRLSRENQRRE